VPCGDEGAEKLTNHFVPSSVRSRPAGRRFRNGLKVRLARGGLAEPDKWPLEEFPTQHRQKDGRGNRGISNRLSSGLADRLFASSDQWIPRGWTAIAAKLALARPT